VVAKEGCLSIGQNMASAAGVRCQLEITHYRVRACRAGYR